MTVFAKQIIRSLGRPATYLPPGGADPVTIRAVVTDADEAFRPAETTIVGGDAVGSVLSSVNPRRGGIIEMKTGAQYEIYGVTAAAVPGLLELALMRLTDTIAAPLFDFSAPVLLTMSEFVEIDGTRVRACVNRQGLFQTTDDNGARIEVVKTVVAFRPSDAPNAREGSVVLIDGEEREIHQIMRDGSGMTRAVL